MTGATWGGSVELCLERFGGNNNLCRFDFVKHDESCHFLPSHVYILMYTCIHTYTHTYTYMCKYVSCVMSL